MSLSVSISYLCIGLVRGYSSPAIPSMQNTSPKFLPLNKNSISWISSIPPFGAFFGSLLAFPLMHFIGRKYTVIVTSPISLVAWMLIASCKNWKILLISRMMSGFAAGLTVPAAQIYVSECCDPKIRGVLGSLPSLAMSLGIFLTYVAGTFVGWRVLAWMCCGCAVFLLFALIPLPESPIWLKSRKRYEAAERSAKWLHLDGFTSEHLMQLEQENTMESYKQSYKYIIYCPIIFKFKNYIIFCIF